MNGLDRKSLLFLTGIFISSLGSTAFIISLLTFPPTLGISPLVIGLIVGTSRITSVLTGFFAGPIGDHVNPRKIVYIGEFGALTCSALLLATSSSLSNSHFMLFLSAAAARSICTAIQAGSTQKMGKQYDEALKLNGKFAKYLNKATFGSIFFAMLINLAAVKFGSFQDMIILDGITFLINGILVLASVDRQSQSVYKPQSLGTPKLTKMWVENRNYIRDHPQQARIDTLLAIAMMGANTLNVVLFMQTPSITPLASGIFGVAVWLAAPVEKYLKPNRSFLWTTLAFSLFAQGILVDFPGAVLLFSLVRNLSYWIIFNEISAEIMKTSRQEGYAGVASGRNIVINLIGAAGEYWVGLKLLPVVAETFWRGLCSILAKVLDRNTSRAAIALSIAAVTIHSQAESKQVLNLPLRATTVNIDPQKMEDVASLFVNRQLYRGLVAFTSELELINDLAEVYSVDENGKRYLFTLRPAKFSDGSPITAADVVRTFQRMLKVKSAIVADLHSISGFDSSDGTLPKALGIKAVSQNQVEFRLNFADPFFIKNLGAVDCSILKLDSDLNILSPTSGRFTYYETNESIKLTLIEPSQFPNAAATVYLKKINNEAQAISLAKKGDLDSLESFEVPELDQKELLASGWRREETQIAKTLFFSLQPTRVDKPNRETIYSLLQNKQGMGLPTGYTAAFGLIPNVLAGALSYSDIKSLLVKVRPKKPYKELKIFYPDGIELKNIAEWAKDILSSSGFKVKIESFPIKDYFKIIRSNEYEMILRSKYLDYPDGMSVLTYFKSGLPINTFHAGNNSTDKLIAEAQLQTDTPKRIDDYRTIQKHLLGNYTIVPVASGSSQSFLTSGKIRKIKAHPMGLHSLYLNEIEIN